MFEIRRENQLVTLVLAHGKVNAMDLQFCQKLRDLLYEMEDSRQCDAVILTGRGNVFSAGVDLVRLIGEDESYLDAFLPALSEMFKAVFSFPKPMVALVNGAAIAGGCVLVCACDYKIALPNAQIGIPELRVGVPFPTVGLEIMRFAANNSSFRRIVNNGKTFAGQDALNAGLADEIVDGAEASIAVRKIAEELSQIPAEVFLHTKQHVRSLALEQINKGERTFEPRIRELWRSPEIRACIRRYVQRKLNK